MNKQIVKAPFQNGQVSIGPREFDVRNGVVIGLEPDDAEISELCRAFGLTIEAGKTLPKPASPKPAPPPVAKEGN